jgi:hypothetical protein
MMFLAQALLFEFHIHYLCDEFLNARLLLFLYGSGILCLKIREQKIKTLTPREAGYTFKLTDKVLLDVRPSNERQKVRLSSIKAIPSVR